MKIGGLVIGETRGGTWSNLRTNVTSEGLPLWGRGGRVNRIGRGETLKAQGASDGRGATYHR